MAQQQPQQPTPQQQQPFTPLSQEQELAALWVDVQRVVSEMGEAVNKVVSSPLPNPGLLNALIIDLQRLQRDCVQVRQLSQLQEEHNLAMRIAAVQQQQQQQQQQGVSPMPPGPMRPLVAGPHVALASPPTQHHHHHHHHHHQRPPAPQQQLPQQQQQQHYRSPAPGPGPAPPGPSPVPRSPHAPPGGLGAPQAMVSPTAFPLAAVQQQQQRGAGGGGEQGQGGGVVSPVGLAVPSSRAIVTPPPRPAAMPLGPSGPWQEQQQQQQPAAAVKQEPGAAPL